MDTNIALFGTNVTYSCDTGYTFPDKSVATTIQCDGQIQAWNKEMADCQSTSLESKYNLSFNLLILKELIKN